MQIIYMGGFSDHLNNGISDDLPAPAPGYHFPTSELCVTYMCRELNLSGDLIPVPIKHDKCTVFKARINFTNRYLFLYIWQVEPYPVTEAHP